MKILTQPASLKKDDYEMSSGPASGKEHEKSIVYDVRISLKEHTPVKVHITYRQRLENNEAQIQEAQRLYKEIRLLQENAFFSPHELTTQKAPLGIMRIRKFWKRRRED